jgi:hypothetical protein
MIGGTAVGGCDVTIDTVGGFVDFVGALVGVSPMGWGPHPVVTTERIIATVTFNTKKRATFALNIRSSFLVIEPHVWNVHRRCKFVPSKPPGGSGFRNVSPTYMVTEYNKQTPWENIKYCFFPTQSVAG